MTFVRVSFRGNVLQRIVCLIGLLVFSCLVNTGRVAARQQKHVNNIYRVFCGTQEGRSIWIVDGKKVREEIFPEFLYGGNNQRYPFIPAGEIWIDHAISAEEFTYTVEHELCERDLMATQGMTYDAAHDSALSLERTHRIRDRGKAQEHEAGLPLVFPRDFYGDKEIDNLPDSMKLRDTYRVYLGKQGGLDVWVVDGAAVRRDMYPDFGLSGNDLAYHFIPAGEIWIDGDVSCEETAFSTEVELLEREALSKGTEYDNAYEQAIQKVLVDRKKNRILADRQPAVVVRPPLTRDQGLKEIR